MPPLMFRLIVDQAIPDADKRRIVYLTIVLVVVALGDAALQIVQRWYSARIGEGLIYDLRVAPIRQSSEYAHRVFHSHENWCVD